MRGMCGWNQPHLIQIELVTCVDCDPQMAVVKRRERAAKDAERLHEALIRARSFSAPNRRPSRPTSSRSDLRDRPERARGKIGRAPVCTPVTNAQLVCRTLLDIKQ